jgi:hypothetical protein
MVVLTGAEIAAIVLLSIGTLILLGLLITLAVWSGCGKGHNDFSMSKKKKHHKTTKEKLAEPTPEKSSLLMF